MARPRRVFVCRFSLPNSLQRADLVVWIKQMLSMHAGGIRVHITSEADSLKIFADSEENSKVVRVAVDTNREDWSGAGVEDVIYH